MSTRFTRPAGTYDSTSVTTNMTKYRADSAATPKVAISSAKMDGDFNTVIDALNALDDDITGLIAGTVPDGSITAPKLASNAVTTAKILDANVTTAKIAPLAVDATLLASNAVTTAKILDANVTETKLANAAVTANKIAADAVTTVKILDGNVTTDKIADDAVTYAKMQNVSDTSRILGRRSAGAGDVEENTLSQVLDMVGSAADGDILIRSGGSWTRLGIGTSGQGLVVSSGLPAWGSAGAVALLQTATASASSTLDFTAFNSTLYNSYIFVIDELVSSATADIWVRFSTDGGSTYQSANSTYFYTYSSLSTVTGTPAITYSSASNATALTRIILSASSTKIVGVMSLLGPGNTGLDDTVVSFVGVDMAPTKTIVRSEGGKHTSFSAGAVNALRFLPASGNFTSGSIRMYGLRAS